MGAVILTLVLTVIAAGSLWLTIGNRLRLHADARQNEILNLAVYAALVFPVFFLIVFFGMERF
jgi:hypothetical protein